VDRGGAIEEVQALVGLVRDVDATAIDVEEFVVLLVTREDRLEGGERIQIVALERERLLEELDRLRAVVQPIFVVARDLRRELVGELGIEVGAVQRLLDSLTSRSQPDPLA